MDDNEIIEYFRHHKLNGTGIRNFLMYKDGAREYVNAQLALHPEYEYPGGYITCLVKEMPLGKCVICGKTLGYKSTTNGHHHCSMECFSKDKGVVEKRSKTCLEKYGVINPGANEIVKAKRNATIRKRYGVDAILRNKDCLAKMKQTMIEKYGVDSYQKTTESKRKCYAKSYQTILGWSEHVIPLFTEDEYHGWKHGEVYRWKCAKCGEEFESDLHVTDICEIQRLPRCMKCHPFMTNESAGEIELKDFIASIYEGTIISHERNALDGMEIDIYLPEKKIAFEFDGLFFHDEFSGKDSEYHLDKTRKCNERGIRLIHVFEDEWKHQKEIVKDRIRSILGIEHTSIYARKCTMAMIPAKESNEFLEQNHLQGADNSSIRYGLYHEGILVAIMTFGKPRFSKSYDWEMVRYASKVGIRVVGGASRLLKTFSNSHKGTIVSYADKRYSDGMLYKVLGFEYVKDSEPNYWWFKAKTKLSRYQCQKHRLHGILGDKFDPEKSETENMHNSGWSRIYDCGNMIFVKKLQS